MKEGQARFGAGREESLPLHERPVTLAPGRSTEIRWRSIKRIVLASVASTVLCGGAAVFLGSAPAHVSGDRVVGAAAHINLHNLMGDPVPWSSTDSDSSSTGDIVTNGSGALFNDGSQVDRG